MTERDEEIRAASRTVHAAAGTLPVPSIATARARHQRRTRAVSAVAIAAVLFGGIAVIANRTGERGAVAIEAAGSGGSVPGTDTRSTARRGPGTTLPQVEPSTTSTAAPSTTSEVPPSSTTTTAPADPDDVLASLAFPAYRGIEHYSLFGPHCPDITHVLDASAIESADRTEWRYHADYCGEQRDDGNWYGEGDITLTGADDDAIRGRFGHAAPIGTAGEPFDMTITGGSGRFAGATGTCRITVQLQDLSFGSQEQSGSIECTLSPPPGR